VSPTQPKTAPAPAKRPTPKVVRSATSVPLKASQPSLSKKADRSGFSTDDALISAAPKPVELQPVDSTAHVTNASFSLWGEE
jgi:hypothetical protein